MIYIYIYTVYTQLLQSRPLFLAMEEDYHQSGYGSALVETRPPPSLVTLFPFSPQISPSPRRLSSHFTEPTRPVRAARQLAWVSLQGRLIGAEEASSARAIGGGLSREEAVAWELFSPIHRILIVAVVAVAASNSKKNKQIYQLKKSVELRDQVLLSMQQKLDILCDQVNYIKDQPHIRNDVAFIKYSEFQCDETFASDKIKSGGCSCQLCDQHQLPSNGLGNSGAKAYGGDEMNCKMPQLNEVEQEERRMSDLSDWAPSVASSVDIQLNTLAVKQDIYNLRKECEEKDASIKELSTVLKSSEVTGSKRITELEDIIRRKNMIITKLRKDLVVLEQQVVNLTRLRRPSFAASSSNVKKQLPVMADNLIYDMDSTTGPSSSDSDSDSSSKNKDNPVRNVEAASRKDQKSENVKGFGSLVKPTDRMQESQPASPLRERSMNQKIDAVLSLRPKQSFSAGGDFQRSKRRAQSGSKDVVASQKRWV